MQGPHLMGKRWVKPPQGEGLLIFRMSGYDDQPDLLVERWWNIFLESESRSVLSDSLRPHGL